MGELSACRLCLCWHFGVKNLSDNLLPRPPTQARGEFWSCNGSGRLGDPTQGGSCRAQRLPLFDVIFIALFFPQLSSAGEGVLRVQTWLDGVTRRAPGHVVRYITQRAAGHHAHVLRLAHENRPHNDCRREKFPLNSESKNPHQAVARQHHCRQNRSNHTQPCCSQD